MGEGTEKSDRELLVELLAEVRKLSEKLVANDVPSDVVTIAQACVMLGCGRTKLYELMKNGRLQRAERIGREPRLVRASVESLVTAAEPEVKPARPRRKVRVPDPLPGQSLGERVRKIPI